MNQLEAHPKNNELEHVNRKPTLNPRDDLDPTQRRKPITRKHAVEQEEVTEKEKGVESDREDDEPRYMSSLTRRTNEANVHPKEKNRGEAESAVPLEKVTDVSLDIRRLVGLWGHYFLTPNRTSSCNEPYGRIP